MKNVYMIIAFMLLVSVLCATPATAFTGEEYIVVIDDSGDIKTYKYLNPNYKVHPDCPNTPGEKYFKIQIYGTNWLKSFVTFKPADIPDAPTMMVDTNSKVNIYLPYYSVDKWEIKYYSNFRKMSPPYDQYLKNAGTVNVKLVFGHYLPRGLELWLGPDQLLCSKNSFYNEDGYVVKPVWSIPEVKK